MLDEMHMSNVALIRDAQFAPAAGMTVITGETGSGKTALLNALKLLVGERANAGMIREGAEELCVEGRFYLGSEDTEDGEVVSRRVGRNGRSRVSIDGSLASVKDLANGVGASIDLCGQHEHQQLLSAAYQRKLFDKWAGVEIATALAHYQEAFDACTAAQEELDCLQALCDSDATAADRARFVMEQIGTVDPQPGEYETLLEELPLYENAEMILNEARSSYSLLTGEAAALDKIEEVSASLAKIAAVDAAMEVQQKAVQEAYYTLEDVAHELARYRKSIDFSETDLEIRQTRLSALQGIMRGYGPTMEAVFNTYEQAAELVASFDSRDELLAEARIVRDRAEEQLLNAADELAAARMQTTPAFERAVTSQMARLEMGSAELQVALSPLPRDQWTRVSPQAIDYLFIPGAGLSPQKLSAIASGGEISRVMLALKVVLGACDDVDTLVFDEIDAGVGGKTAVALAAVLKDLSQTHQVIVVTHLPQVAVMGDAHYLVEKTEDPVLTTEILPISGTAREEEIARMLSGKIDATSLAHAKEMLQVD